MGSGLDVIDRVAALTPDTKVLICSAMSGAASIRRALWGGAVGYVAKSASDAD